MRHVVLVVQINVEVCGYSGFPISYRKSSMTMYQATLLKVRQNRYAIPLGFFASSVIVGMLFYLCAITFC